MESGGLFFEEFGSGSFEFNRFNFRPAQSTHRDFMKLIFTQRHSGSGCARRNSRPQQGGATGTAAKATAGGSRGPYPHTRLIGIPQASSCRSSYPVTGDFCGLYSPEV
eukprot:745960-Rhodomonas_salina.1